jgi:hypothetical protein
LLAWTKDVVGLAGALEVGHGMEKKEAWHGIVERLERELTPLNGEESEGEGKGRRKGEAKKRRLTVGGGERAGRLLSVASGKGC